MIYFLERCSPWILSVLRIAVAVTILAHGGETVFNFPATSHERPALGSIDGMLGIAQLAVGLFLLLGLFTRITSGIGFATLVTLYICTYLDEGLLPIHTHGEWAMLCGAATLYFITVGAGPLSIDRLIRGPDEYEEEYVEEVVVEGQAPAPQQGPAEPGS